MTRTTSYDFQIEVEATVASLSSIIRAELQALSGEYWTPRFQADQMDAELKYRRERIAFLRKQREDFENLMFGVGPEGV